ncbi:hypothetical protein EI94DRAFT_1802961 [Lactarius quietus]|nr:hypothetical protein EI94DRAFT_1802961 [Lactarius quietus]
MQTPVHDQRTPFPSSSTTTPLCGTRRRRGSDDFYNFDEDVVIARPAGMIPITPGTSKHLKASCEDTANIYDVDPQQLRPFVESPTMLHMLLRLEAHLLNVQNMLAKKEIDTLFESPDFKTGLQDRLQVALLSPGIPAYVTDIAPRMMVIIKQQWKLFKVPMELFEDPDSHSQLETMVSETLTSTRSSIKQKRSAFRDFIKVTRLKKPAGALIPLCKCPKNTRNLVGLKSNELDALSASMSVSEGASGDEDDDGIENDLEGGSDNDTNIAITGKEYTPLQFWNYVDDYLEYIHTVLFAGIQDPAARDRKIAWFFNEALQVDIYNYRDGSKIPLKPSSDQPPMWQQILHRSTHWA